MKKKINKKKLNSEGRQRPEQHKTGRPWKAFFFPWTDWLMTRGSQLAAGQIEKRRTVLFK
ncbi:hypothetical protein CUU66_03410 [Peribacillus deserti]|uniref:Uncharacterized protein n=1 Tax=Peribacillus deserti TaxID=673318 RepID=A0A2N5MA84_9BACI|nr:hypothetical protein CUU66_03410 [Peribacillus deserti]